MLPLLPCYISIIAISVPAFILGWMFRGRYNKGHENLLYVDEYTNIHFPRYMEPGDMLAWTEKIADAIKKREASAQSKPAGSHAADDGTSDQAKQPKNEPDGEFFPKPQHRFYPSGEALISGAKPWVTNPGDK